MKSEFETLTFYSYKGGVGRSLALWNIAMVMARFGKNVAIVDFDLEAPGLHYKFKLHSKKNRENTNQTLLGLVDYISSICIENTIPKNINDFFYEMDLDEEFTGSIALMPAGDAPSLEYIKKLRKIKWSELFLSSSESEEELPIGIPLFLNLKEKIAKELEFKNNVEKHNVDYLFIDSRTGITEIGGVALNLMPDKILCLLISNDENQEGARFALRHAKVTANDSKVKDDLEIVCALSRLPDNWPETPLSNEEKKCFDLQCFLNEPSERLPRGLEVDNLLVLHSDPSLEVEEELCSLGLKTPNESLLLRDYFMLIKKLDLHLKMNNEEQEFVNTISSINFVSNNIEQIVSDRLRRGHRFAWPDDVHPKGEVKNRISERKKQGSQGVFRALAPVYHPEMNDKGEKLFPLFNSLVKECVKHLGGDPTELIHENRDLWDQLISMRMHEGHYDFCGEMYFLSNTRSHLVGLVQLGWIRRFGLVVNQSSRVYQILKHVYQRNPNKLVLRDVFFEIIGNIDVPISALILGETAAGSEAVRMLGGMASKVPIVTLSNEGTMRDKIDGSRKTDKEIIAICDHVVGKSIATESANLLYFNPVFPSKNPELACSFRRPIPVGFPYPIDDFDWRREISNALAQAIWSNRKDGNWWDSKSQKSLSFEVAKAGIDLFSINDLCRSLLLDMAPKDSLKWMVRFKEVGMIRQ